MKKTTVVFFLVFTAAIANSQIIEPVKWSFDSKQNGKEIELNFNATIDEGWYIYDTYFPDSNTIATEIVFEDSTLFVSVEELLKEPQPAEKFDSIIQTNVRYFSNKVTLTKKIQLLTDNPVVIRGHVLYMGCNNEICLAPNEVQFLFSFNHEEDKAIEEIESDNAVSYAPSSSTGQTLLVFILMSVLAGFAAILTPCVLPMIPMTVSFFMHKSENRGKMIRNGVLFGFYITLIFTSLGALFSFGIFRPDIGSILSTHWIPNLLFFVFFIVFSMSLLGKFNMVLPSSLINKVDAKADKGGIFGIFFMALTTVIVSFSCTSPFVGVIIIEAVQGGYIRPLIGMFFWGLSFAAPFTLLAVFPSILNKLPKSGAWLNTVKVVSAFVIMALGLKFLTNIDQVYKLDIVNRENYLSIWIAIFFLLGLYLLGKIKFHNDSNSSYIGVGRLFLSIAVFSFVIYLFTGLLGNPLTSISSLIPPANKRTVFLSQNTNTGFAGGNTDELCSQAKYADKLHLPHGLSGYFDLEEGMACAKKQGKPALIVFKGHICANCKKMENKVWADPEVLRILSEKYVIIGLYTDDRTTLPENEWI
ncbi:MAG: thioredoxin family protein, partial [Bacteroidales bacterium]|nr:thioredoxin family protein [Bacteroidales bacterium]